MKIKTELALISGRLVVGWSIQEFLEACINAAVPIESDQYLWFSALWKTVNACVLVYIGAKIEAYYDKKKAEDDEANKGHNPSDECMINSSGDGSTTNPLSPQASLGNEVRSASNDHKDILDPNQSIINKTKNSKNNQSKNSSLQTPLLDNEL